MCNFVANRLCCDAADRAMQVHGGLGYSRHQPFEHIYRHHRRYRITEGAEEIQMRRVAGVGCRRRRSGWAAKAGALNPPAQGAADLGSLAGFVLEGELELGAIGDRPALVQVNVLLDDLGHPQITDRPGGSPDRLRCRVFP